MKVSIKQIGEKKDEQVIIECVAVTAEIERIQSFVLANGTILTGLFEERMYQFPLEEVYYFEAVDERVFAYTKGKSYEMKIRLYELESAFSEHYFVRCSKSFVLNLMKLESLSPALNGRFCAHMKNGEKIIISRQYVPHIKQIVLRGKA